MPIIQMDIQCLAKIFNHLKSNQFHLDYKWQIVHATMFIVTQNAHKTHFQSQNSLFIGRSLKNKIRKMLFAYVFNLLPRTTFWCNNSFKSCCYRSHDRVVWYPNLGTPVLIQSRQMPFCEEKRLEQLLQPLL